MRNQKSLATRRNGDRLGSCQCESGLSSIRSGGVVHIPRILVVAGQNVLHVAKSDHSESLCEVTRKCNALKFLGKISADADA